MQLKVINSENLKNLYFNIIDLNSYIINVFANAHNTHLLL